MCTRPRKKEGEEASRHRRGRGRQCRDRAAKHARSREAGGCGGQGGGARRAADRGAGAVCEPVGGREGGEEGVEVGKER